MTDVFVLSNGKYFIKPHNELSNTPGHANKHPSLMHAHMMTSLVEALEFKSHCQGIVHNISEYTIYKLYQKQLVVNPVQSEYLDILNQFKILQARLNELSPRLTTHTVNGDDNE